MCSRISIIVAAKAVARVAGKGNGGNLPLEARRSRPTGLNGCHRPKTNPMRPASTFFRSRTNARPHSGARHAIDRTSNRAHRTSVGAARGAPVTLRGGRREMKLRSFSSGFASSLAGGRSILITCGGPFGPAHHLRDSAVAIGNGGCHFSSCFPAPLAAAGS